MNLNEVTTELQDALASGGIRSALAYLNCLSGYRFTAMYRFDGPMLRNLYFYDRENPAVEDTDDYPVEVTYCVFIRENGKPFIMEDALIDARVKGHPAQKRIRSYCGVPISDSERRIVGTMCHFDCEPFQASESAVDLMESLAPLLLSHEKTTRKL